MASKQVAKKPAVTVEPTAASKAKDAEAKPASYRVDLGESLPAQAPIPTATDKKK